MDRRTLRAAAFITGTLFVFGGGCVAMVAGAAGAMVASGGGSTTDAAGDAVGEVADRAGRVVSAGIRGIATAGAGRAGGDRIRAAEQAGRIVKATRDAVREDPVLAEADSDVN